MKPWGVHACILDADCRRWGSPRRLHLFTPWGVLILAVGYNSWTQAWLPRLGYQRWWSPIVWHPRGERDE